MNAYDKLYAAEAQAVGRFVTVERKDLCELMADLSQLRAVAPVKRGKAEYPVAFLAAYDAMKDHGARWREGSTPAAAYKQWAARMKAGADAEQVLAGTVRYALYLKATASEPKMAQTFFGQGEHYTAEWTLPSRLLLNDVGRLVLSRASAADQNRANNAEALRILGQPMFPDDGMTIEAAP